MFRLDDVSKSYAGLVAIEHLSLTIADIYFRNTALWMWHARL